MTSGIAAQNALQEQPSLLLKLTHGYGAAAFGIKDNGFDYFQPLFY